MKFLTKPKWIYGLLISCTIFFFSSVLAGDPLITRHFSGVWDQPEQESQGIILQVGEQDGDQKVGIAYWFTYGEDLQTTWFLGVGPVNGNEINMKLYTAFNIAFMEGNVEGNANVEEIGTLDLVFKNCNHGTATFATAEDMIGSGDFPIKRINSIYRTRCSGGISDDTPSDRKPEQLEVRLQPATDGGTGEGKAKFWERTDRSDFKVEAEGIADGDYSLKICEEVVGELVVSAGEGELAFRSPAEDDLLEMTFDPRDCKIDLLSGESVILTSADAVLSEKSNGNEDEDNGDKEGIEVEIDLDNTGVIDGAKGEAGLESYADESEFSIKIKDIPAGSYSAKVGGAEVGVIEVVEDDGEFEGKIKFKDPVKGGGLALDFDPRGQLIEIQNAETAVILSALFPDE